MKSQIPVFHYKKSIHTTFLTSVVNVTNPEGRMLTVPLLAAHLLKLPKFEKCKKSWF